jgi:4-hydroxy-3-methylbut-2-enyl diphosphate reductase
VQGKVVRLVPFGAFVELEPGLDGLIHISQIAPRHVTKPENELAVDEIVNVKILGIDDENKKISLSKKEADGIAVTQDEAQPSDIPAEPADLTQETVDETNSDAADH